MSQPSRIPALGLEERGQRRRAGGRSRARSWGRCYSASESCDAQGSPPPQPPWLPKSWHQGDADISPQQGFQELSLVQMFLEVNNRFPAAPCPGDRHSRSQKRSSGTKAQPGAASTAGSPRATHGDVRGWRDTDPLPPRRVTYSKPFFFPQKWDVSCIYCVYCFW